MSRAGSQKRVGQALNASRHGDRASLSARAAAVSIALVGLLLAYGAARWVGERNAEVASDRFEVAASRMVARIEDRLARYEYGLRGTRGAIIAAGADRITREAFRRYSRSRDIGREFPGVRGFGFVRRISPDDEAAFLRLARQEDPAFEIRQLAPNPGERFVIQFVEPLDRNIEAVGLDVASDPERKAAALRAVETGSATITEPLTLLQAPGTGERSFLLFLPAFAPDRPTGTPEERSGATFGWSYAPLVIDDVLNGLDLESGELDFAINDRASTEKAPFFATPGMLEPSEATLSTLRVARIYGRDWAIAIRARPAFLADFNRPEPGVVGVVTALLGFLVAILASMALTGRRREILAAVQTNRLAAIVRNADEAILGKTLDGTITDWNPAAERLFGYTAAEAVGRRIVELIIPVHLREEEQGMLAAIGRGEAVPTRSTLRRRRDGGIVHVLVGVSPICAPGGALVGAATVMRDISEQVASAARIRALNEDLERQVAARTEELRASVALRAAILQHADYAIIAADPDDRITIFNPAAERLLGYAADEVVGRVSPTLFLDSADLNPCALHAGGHEGPAHVGEWTYVAKGGRRIPVLLSVSALRSERDEALGYVIIAMDLSERRRHAAEMRAAKAGTWSYDIASGRVRLSAECARQHGLPDAEVEIDVETQWRRLAHPDDVARVLADLRAAIASRGSYTAEFRVVLPDGGIRWLTAIGHSEVEHTPLPRRVIGLTLDITARKEAEIALVEARREAESANRAKGEFLAAMSHEIRTPLHAILGFTGLMLGSGRLGAEDRRHVELVRSAGSALLTVVNDILNASKIEAGAVTLELRPFRPRELAANCVAFIRGLAEAKGLGLRLDVDDDLPAALLGDEGRLRQVLLNLLNNAVKFTRQGRVTLHVRHEGSRAGGDDLRFAVSDTGIGIPEDKRGRLFRRFSQVDGSVEREFGGTGLGLAISKALVELMGGEIGCESEHGAGSIFWFALQLPRADMPGPAADADAAARHPRRHARLLLVEDNCVNETLARDVLERAGYAVTSVSNGERAVQAVADGAFDAVLMDVQMPGMDGLSATAAIRDLPGRAGQVVVIGLSAGVLPEQVQRCRDAGMNDHVCKPFTADALLATVDRWLYGGGDHDPDGAVGVEGFGFDGAAGTFRPDRLRQVLSLLDEDLEQAFQCPCDAPDDRARLRFEAHSLTSAAAMVGLREVAAICRRLSGFDEARVSAEGVAAFRFVLAQARALRDRAQMSIRAQLDDPGCLKFNHISCSTHTFGSAWLPHESARDISNTNDDFADNRSTA